MTTYAWLGITDQDDRFAHCSTVLPVRKGMFFNMTFVMLLEANEASTTGHGLSAPHHAPTAPSFNVQSSRCTYGVMLKGAGCNITHRNTSTDLQGN